MHTDPYNLWRQRRAEGDAPEGFADRVLDAVRHDKSKATRALLLRAFLARVFASPLLRSAACVLACLACLLRMGLVVALFLFQ